MLYKEKYIPEIEVMLHRNDSLTKNYVNYEDKILDRSLSPYLYSNGKMSTFLNMLNKLVSLYFDSFNILKNWKNYTVDKYYYKHSS